ncbi:conserved hypothetical protein [Uncinocarpus reesii 1704]|uniref:Uncharacterized protein n=1 Tax=Uncinocarpus reesii (strain UAMH 1704) TaxID=336963 RepID=C4JW64_UNCRE|nr:uncharacterized protein UREG_06806 [Uncinocarpus reesii 1704]EEP81941.1 conserved hypothetical protein [Uncinocarpus reesii 1704]
MNCPSRTEHDPIHPDWNQNPPFLSPDLTAREDLNGRVNTTQIREASSHFSALGLAVGGNEGLEKGLDVPPALKATRPLADAKFRRGYYEVILSTFEKRPKPTKRPMVKRAVACETGSAKPNYSVSLHVGAIAIILFVSFTACAFPMLVVRFPRLRIPPAFLFFVRHFGTGVLVATAFVHLLPTAFLSLGNPCLSQFWTEDYPAMPGAIALGAVFLVASVEMIFSPARHICGGSREVTDLICNQGSRPAGQDKLELDASVVEALGSANRSNSVSNLTAHDHIQTEPRPDQSRNGARDLPKRSPTGDRPEIVTSDGAIRRNIDEIRASEDFAPIHLTPEQRVQKAFMQCVLLEVGILFHSVFIGMALSVSVGNEFVILLVAITFHQSFEGLALGARIASLSWTSDALQPWLMALAYGCTTPLGQAIGLATHSLYDPDSEIGLIMVGTMNAISSGLLVYASLVELLSEDFLSDESWRTLRGKQRVYACLLVFFGAFGMSLVGAWA